MRGCPDREEALVLHAAGDLDAGASRELVAHLAACPACAREHAELRALLAEVAASAPSLSPDREEAFVERVRAALPAPAPVTRLAPRRAIRSLAALGALAAAAAVAVFVLRPGGPETSADGAVDAAAIAETLPDAGLAEPLQVTAAWDGDDLSRLAATLAAAAVGEDDGAAEETAPEATDYDLVALSDDELLGLERLLAGSGG